MVKLPNDASGQWWRSLDDQSLVQAVGQLHLARIDAFDRRDGPTYVRAHEGLRQGQDQLARWARSFFFEVAPDNFEFLEPHPRTVEAEVHEVPFPEWSTRFVGAVAKNIGQPTSRVTNWERAAGLLLSVYCADRVLGGPLRSVELVADVGAEINLKTYPSALIDAVQADWTNLRFQADITRLAYKVQSRQIDREEAAHLRLGSDAIPNGWAESYTGLAPSNGMRLMELNRGVVEFLRDPRRRLGDVVDSPPELFAASMRADGATRYCEQYLSAVELEATLEGKEPQAAVEAFQESVHEIAVAPMAELSSWVHDVGAARSILKFGM